jgi:hypothetical protein
MPTKKAPLKKRTFIRNKSPLPSLPANTSTPVTKTEETPKVGKPVSLPLVFLSIFLSLAAIIFVLFYTGKIKTPPVTFSSNLTPTPTEIPITLAPTPTPDIKILSISILNGSDKTGAAAGLRNILRENGYTGINIGNADNTDYQNTLIRIKSEFKEQYLAPLEELLSQSYNLDPTEELDSQSKYDIVIILGKR